MFADSYFLSACEPVTRIKQSIGLECKVSMIKKSVFNTPLAAQSFYYMAYFTQALTLGADPVPQNNFSRLCSVSRINGFYHNVLDVQTHASTP